MLLDASSQRAKSWSCEHCANFLELHDPSVCRTCFWASPESYEHVAMQDQRRVDLVWQGVKEVREYVRIAQAAADAQQPLAEYIKRQLRGKV